MDLSGMVNNIFNQEPEEEEEEEFFVFTGFVPLKKPDWYFGEI